MFRMVERPTLMPACTLLRSTVGPVLDTEVILRNGGRVYLSEIEVQEAAKYFPDAVGRLAHDFGWMNPAEVQELRDEIAELRSQLADAQTGQPVVVSLEDALAIANTGAVAA